MFKNKLKLFVSDTPNNSIHTLVDRWLMYQNTDCDVHIQVPDCSLSFDMLVELFSGLLGIPSEDAKVFLLNKFNKTEEELSTVKFTLDDQDIVKGEYSPFGIKVKF